MYVYYCSRDSESEEPEPEREHDPQLGRQSEYQHDHRDEAVSDKRSEPELEPVPKSELMQGQEPALEPPSKRKPESKPQLESQPVAQLQSHSHATANLAASNLSTASPKLIQLMHQTAPQGVVAGMPSTSRHHCAAPVDGAGVPLIARWRRRLVC